MAKVNPNSLSLFSRFAGCGMFILLLLILYVNGVVSMTGLLLLTLANLSSALLGGYYAFNDDDEINYKLMEKPYTINPLL